MLSPDRREITRKPTPFIGEIPESAEPMKHTVFCAIGGGGSSALITRVAKYAAFVGMRPDNLFQVRGGFDRVLETGALHLSPSTALSGVVADAPHNEDFDLWGAVRSWRTQTGYIIDPCLTVGANLDAYLGWLRAYGGAAVFWQLPAFRYFSSQRMQDVVFLVRRPLDAWASFTEPWRHAALLDEFGGRETSRALGVFCRWWSSHVDEYLALRDADCSPVLLRYDHAYEDGAELPAALREQFAPGSAWRPRVRDPDDIPDRARRFIESRTEHLTTRIWRTE
jgi:hypothetical protein